MEQMHRAPWLPGDRRRVWPVGPLQVRFEIFAKKIDLIPGVGFNWEEGIFSIFIYWMNVSLSLDYEYLPDWEHSQEAIQARQLPDNN